MLYMLFSFIPWIVYWVLCDMGNILGIIIPLVIALLLIIPQIRKRDFNLMDVTTLFYFCITITATFIFNLNIFVEKSGFLGYSVLFLMVLFSLIIKQPYTLQVSKRDYPEIYWKERSFLAINNIITGVWAVIFIANAIAFLLLNATSAAILSNTLIALTFIVGIFSESELFSSHLKTVTPQVNP